MSYKVFVGYTMLGQCLGDDDETRQQGHLCIQSTVRVKVKIGVTTWQASALASSQDCKRKDTIKAEYHDTGNLVWMLACICPSTRGAISSGYRSSASIKVSRPAQTPQHPKTSRQLLVFYGPFCSLQQTSHRFPSSQSLIIGFPICFRLPALLEQWLLLMTLFPCYRSRTTKTLQTMSASRSGLATNPASFRNQKLYLHKQELAISISQLLQAPRQSTKIRD